MLSESRQLLDSITNAFKAVQGNKTENHEVVDSGYPQSIDSGERKAPHSIFTTSQKLQVIEVAPLKELP